MKQGKALPYLWAEQLWPWLRVELLLHWKPPASFSDRIRPDKETMSFPKNEHFPTVFRQCLLLVGKTLVIKFQVQSLRFYAISMH